MRVAAATTALVLLTGCASTVAGTPTSAGGAPTEETTETTDTTDTTETTEPTETSESEPDTGELACAGDDVIAPDGQPFCFNNPEGFEQTVVSQETEAGNPASYSTGVGISAEDLINFNVYDLAPADSDVLSDQELIDALSTVIDSLAAQGIDFTATEPQIVEVDGARALFYTGGDGAGLRIDTYFIFRGSIELQVSCQWRELEQEILAGCDQVLNSLQLTG